MRRFSQRNSLVTLNEINITPLLDLAFVLLIIFVITRPLLEQSIDLKLPPGGVPRGKVEAKDAQTVEIAPNGVYKLNGRTLPLERVMENLGVAFQRNQNSFVVIRADQEGAYKHVAAIFNACQKSGITRFSLSTFPDYK